MQSTAYSQNTKSQAWQHHARLNIYSPVPKQEQKNNIIESVVVAVLFSAFMYLGALVVYLYN